MVLVHFNVLHWNFPTETKKNHRNLEGQYPGQNSNRYLQNTSLQHYYYTVLLSS